MTDSARHTGAPDVAIALAQHCLDTSYAALPQPVVDATKAQIIDTLGIALAGRTHEGVRQLREFTVEMAGKPEALLWGGDERVPAHDAARVNAAAAHALEYDDTHEGSFVHPAVITVPTAIAVSATVKDVRGRDLIAAIALGVDVACRLAEASRPGVPAFTQGWHNTSLYGFFSSALVAGKLMGLTRDQLVSALGIAYHQAAGNAQAHIDGALTKRLGPGFASYGGILSARLAARGVRGATNVFEGARGFFSQYHGGQYDRALLLDGIGTRFAGADVSFKPWPACRGTHTAIDAALSLVAAHGVRAEDVAAITIANAPGEFAFLASPLEKKRHPTTAVDAQFSVPWAVAAALADRDVTLDHFTREAIRRDDLRALTERISTVEDDQLTNSAGPGGARIDVTLTDGRSLRSTIATAKGEPANPLSEDELHRKFASCARLSGVSDAHARTLLETARRLEDLPQATELVSLLARRT